MTAGPAIRRSRRRLLLLLAICVLPPLSAYLLYFVFPQWIPPHRINHGRLLQPAKPLPPVELQLADGRAPPAALLHGKWSLVVFGFDHCAKSCVRRVRLMRNLREVLREDSKRVHVLYLAADDHALTAAQSALGPPAAGFFPVAPVPADRSKLRAFFAGSDAPGAVAVIDPLGNWVLSYAPEAPPKDVYLDLKVLLRFSQIG